MTRTQVHVALALLRKVLPDLASVEVSGNPDRPLMVQVVRFSDGEQLEAPRPVIDVSGVSRLIEMDKAETAAIETEAATAIKAKKPTGGAAHKYRRTIGRSE
jgi:hypothetical protein